MAFGAMRLGGDIFSSILGTPQGKCGRDLATNSAATLATGGYTRVITWRDVEAFKWLQNGCSVGSSISVGD